MKANKDKTDPEFKKAIDDWCDEMGEIKNQSQEQPIENEDELWMQTINVIETCQFMKYKYDDIISRIKKQFTITNNKI